jgi:hypothetical protein
MGNNESGFASQDYTAGQLNAIVKLLRKQAGGDGVERFLRGELTVSEPAHSWREDNGVIRFSLPQTDGTTGEQWISRLEGKKFNVGNYAKSVLRSSDFQPTSGVTYEIAILKGLLFADDVRITSNIRAEAERRKFAKLKNAEISCLIREKFTDKEIEAMGLWAIVGMHDPIKDSGGDLDLLGASRDGRGRSLRAFGGNPDRGWDREDGFAFSVEQVISP